MIDDLAVDVSSLADRWFVIVEYCAGLDPNPYAQVTPMLVGGYWCEVVSGAYLPLHRWPLDGMALRGHEWAPPGDARDNWSRHAKDAGAAARVMVQALRLGRACTDPQAFIWHTGRFPPPEGREQSPPLHPRDPFGLAA